MDKKQERVTMAMFSEFLIDSINLYQSTGINAYTHAEKKISKPINKVITKSQKISPRDETKSSLMFNVVGNKYEKTCPYCEEKGHTTIKDYKKVKMFPVQARRQLAEANFLCYRCLICHNFDDCTVPMCDVCDKPHHSCYISQKQVATYSAHQKTLVKVTQK